MSADDDFYSEQRVRQRIHYEWQRTALFVALIAAACYCIHVFYGGNR